jgi:hypothetical protein
MIDMIGAPVINPDCCPIPVENQITVFLNLFQEHPSSQVKCMKKEHSPISPEANISTFYVRHIIYVGNSAI